MSVLIIEIMSYPSKAHFSGEESEDDGFVKTGPRRRPTAAHL